MGTFTTSAARSALAALLLCGIALPAVAQNSSSPQNNTAPQVIPGLGNFSLPGSPVPIPRSTPAIVTRPTPTPSATPAVPLNPIPRATPTAAPTARATPALRTTPTPTATPSPAATRTPAAASSTPTPTPAPSATSPIDTITPIATPTGEPSIAPATSVAENASSFPTWTVLGVLLVLALGAGGFVLLRKRQRVAEMQFEPEPIVAPEPAQHPTPAPPVPTAAPKPALATPVPAVALAPSPAAKPAPAAHPAPSMLSPRPVSALGSGAKLAVALLPKRAGTNLTGAAAEYDIVVTNEGDAPASAIRLDARLMSASAEQDRVIGMLYADTIERPNVAPFDLGAGETVSLGGKAILPREHVAPLRVGDKQLFVPVLVVNLRYRRGDQDAQTGRAFMIGAAREGDAKLAPFPLDTPRMRTDVAALPYTLTADA